MTTENIETRLKHLEKSNRRLKAGYIVSALCMALIFLTAAQRSTQGDVMSVKEIRVLDDSGKAVVYLNAAGLSINP